MKKKNLTVTIGYFEETISSCKYFLSFSFTVVLIDNFIPEFANNF
jgi:hypothetical protein